MAPPGSAHINFTLGGLAIAGGAMGFAKKRSTPSLIAGVACGSLLVGSGVLISKNESFRGHALASGVNGIMAAAMAKRYASSRKFMPAGLVAVLGSVGFAYNVRKTLEWWPESE